MSSYAEGMGVATGIAFDRDHNLYVGDRSGTIFKIAGIARFRLRYAGTQRLRLSPRLRPCGYLYVTGRRHPASTAVYRIDPHGTVSNFIAASAGRRDWPSMSTATSTSPPRSAGKRGIVKITPDGKANLEVAGQNLVGLCFAPGRSAVLATTGAVHHLSWNIAGYAVASGISHAASLRKEEGHDFSRADRREKCVRASAPGGALSHTASRSSKLNVDS